MCNGKDDVLLIKWYRLEDFKIHTELNITL
jgi:hypothetical protein